MSDAEWWELFFNKSYAILVFFICILGFRQGYHMDDDNFFQNELDRKYYEKIRKVYEDYLDDYL